MVGDGGREQRLYCLHDDCRVTVSMRDFLYSPVGSDAR